MVHISHDLLGLSEDLRFFKGLEVYLNQDLPGVVLNLKGVHYMNSSGLNLLVRLLKQAQRVNSSLLLVSPDEQVIKLLKITKLNKVFNICTSEHEAVKIIKQTKK